MTIDTDDFESRLEAFNSQQEPAKPVEKPEAHAVKSEQEGEPTSEVTPPANDEPPAEPFPGYLSLPEDARKAVDAALQERENQIQEAAQRYRMLHGQVAPLQREVAKLKQAPKPEPSETRTPEQRTDTGKKAERWDKLKATLGEDAEAIEELLETRLAQLRDQDLKPVSEKLGLLDKLAAKTELDDARYQISEAHEGWESTLASEDFQDWHRYLRQSNPRIASRIKEGLEAGNVAEHIFALDLYTEHMKVLQASQGQQEPPRIRTPDPIPTSRRGVASTSSNPVTKTGNAFEDRWNAFLEKK